MSKRARIARCVMWSTLTTTLLAPASFADTLSQAESAPKETTTELHQQEKADAWELALEQDDITVFTREIVGSKLKAFRGEMILENTSLAQIETFLKDINNTPKWLDRCDEAVLVEQLSEEAVILYVSLEMPWPVKDRDVVGLSELSFSNDGKTMRTSIKKIERSDHPPVKGRVRADEMRSELNFTKMDDGRIRVIMQGHAEPGGHIPSWLANLLVTESPYNSLVNLRTLIPKAPNAVAQHKPNTKNNAQ